MKKKWVFIAILLFAGGVFWAGRASKKPVPLPVMPPETIIVETVKVVEIPTEIRVEVPVHGPPPKPVEVIKWKTKEVPVPVETVRTVVEYVTAEQDLSEVLGRVSITSVKFEGLVGNTLSYGWKGKANCDIGLPGEESLTTWLPLVAHPFDLTASTSISTISPKDARPFPWRLDLRLGATSRAGLIAGGSFHTNSRIGFFVHGTFEPRSNTIPAFKGDDDFYSPSFEEVTKWEWGAQLGVEFTIGRK